MKLSVYFFILISLLLFLFGWILTHARDLFSANVAITGLIIIVVVFYILFFYRKTVRPLQNISNGMDLLKEQDFSSRLRKVGQYEADKVVSIFNKMMEQLKNERLRLREQNEFMDLLIHASPMGVIVMNYDNEVADINPAGLRMLGLQHLDSIKGKKLSQCSEHVLIDLTAIKMNETDTLTLNDGAIYKCTLASFIDKGFPRSFYLIESLTDEVRRAEKKAYEKVIRMISHEVNNTTAGLTSTLDTVEKELEYVTNTEDMREAMRVCIERCYGMSKFITNFADVVKIPKAERTPTDLNALIKSSARFMEVMCTHRNIHLSYTLDENLSLIDLDASLFEQVLLNIIKNSAESIEQNGEIRIQTSQNPRMITISDNGKGIPKHVESKLFSPFFSTKSFGQGIGLLFIREVLFQHHFAYSLRTDADGWTRFVIKF